MLNNGSYNGRPMPADTSVLVFLSFLGAAGNLGPSARATVAASGCSRVAKSTALVQRLAAYSRTGLLAAGASRRLSFPLSLRQDYQSAWAGFGNPAPPCGSYAVRFGIDEPAVAAVVLA